jgi:hypothetical protein
VTGSSSREIKAPGVARMAAACPKRGVKTPGGRARLHEAALTPGLSRPANRYGSKRIKNAAGDAEVLRRSLMAGFAVGRTLQDYRLQVS